MITPSMRGKTMIWRLWYDFLYFDRFLLITVPGHLLNSHTHNQERDVNEESGWKLVHGDVFRPPRSLAMLSALVGNGAQLATLVLLVIILAIVGMLYVGYVCSRLY